MIEHTTLINNQEMQNTSDYTQAFNAVKAAYNAILAAYPWKTGSEVTVGELIISTYAVYYFTANSYIKISTNANYPEVKIDIVTPNASKRVADLVNIYWTFSVGKTAKGVCICAYSGAKDSRDPHFYNLYIGEITLLDGTITKGCVYVADDNSYVVATDNGISEEATFNSIIDGTRKGYLIPVTDSTFGGVFKDIYMMACAPIKFNKMKVADKKYLCGKAFCLADE